MAIIKLTIELNTEKIHDIVALEDRGSIINPYSGPIIVKETPEQVREIIKKSKEA